MIIEYEKTILEKIEDVNREATANRRKIKKITLSRTEWLEFVREVHRMLPNVERRSLIKEGYGVFQGLRIKCAKETKG